MHPEEFARPVKQKVLAKTKGYAYEFKCLSARVLQAFAWKHLLAFTHIRPIDTLHP